MVPSPAMVAYDVILLLAVGYIWWFFFKRWDRYVAELRKYFQLAAVFLFLGFIGRLIDLVENFYEVPYYLEVTTFLYGVSIVGVTVTMISYIRALEGSYVPAPGRLPNPPKKENPKTYLLSGSREKLMEIKNIISNKGPVIVFTRYPQFYRDNSSQISAVWITNASDSGSPQRSFT